LQTKFVLVKSKLLIDTKTQGSIERTLPKTILLVHWRKFSNLSIKKR
jgi:hypothetical protein